MSPRSAQRFWENDMRKTKDLEQFQQKCVTVLRPELRENKEIDHFRDSEKSGNDLKRDAL